LRFIYVQKDQSDGGARKAKAKRGQHDGTAGFSPWEGKIAGIC
jgi:hypothetical protein